MEDKAGDAVLVMLAERVAEGTVCPSEVARRINPGPDWRDAMPAVHAAVEVLVTKNLVQLSWKGEPLSLRKGPYRISRSVAN